MKKPTLALLPTIFLLLVTLIIIGVLYNNNTKLKSQIAQREALIKKGQANDSLNCEHTERYANTVTKYITSDCGLVVGGKKVTLEQFIAIYSANQKETEELAKEIYTLEKKINLLTIQGIKHQIEDLRKQDSLDYYLGQIRNINKHYGITLHTRRSGQYRITDYESKKVDSAFALLNVYRKRLSYDSLTHRWTVRMR